MHSIFARLNAVSALASSCLLALLAGITLSSLVPIPGFAPGQPEAGEIAVTNVRVFPASNTHFRSLNREFAFVNFNANADLTPLFTWNTKQLFVWLGVEYTSADGTKNDLVLWDRIVRRKQDARLRVKAKNKYAFRDIARSFKNVTDAHYTLRYNVMPHVGLLTYGEAARTAEPVRFPAAGDAIGSS